MAVPPSKNSTLPVGLPKPGEVADTVPVYVTVCPVTAGFTDEVRATAVSDWFIVSEIGAEVDVAKLASPLKTAEIECGLPAVSA
jgi:hypothetical protein